MSKRTPDQIDLSILDLCNILPGYDAQTTVAMTQQGAKLADKLGYTRYWFAEHHNIDTVLSSTPAIMAAHIGTMTKRIRIGSGGVMLPNHAPLHVVEDFALLDALYPGRIDLGLGRAPGTDPLTAYALRRSKEALLENDFPKDMSELLNFYDRSFSEAHPYHKITPTAFAHLQPEIYILGSSTGGVQVAIDNGLGFVFAAHINPSLAAPVLNVYRDRFVSSKRFEKPKGIVSTIVIVADTEEEARYLAGPSELMWAQIGSVRSTGYKTPEEAAAHNWTLREKLARDEGKDRFIVGTIEQVTEKMMHLADACKVDEVMIFDAYPDPISRERGYRLLADAFSLDTQEED